MSRSPSPKPSVLRSAAKRRRKEESDAAAVLEGVHKQRELMVAYVRQEHLRLKESFLPWLDTWEKLLQEIESDIFFVGFPRLCKSMFEDLPEKEKRVADEAWPEKDQTLELFAAVRASVISMLHTMLPLYTSLAKGADFDNDWTNNMRRHIAAALDNFKAIKTDDSITLELINEFADAVAPLCWRLGEFKTVCVDAKTLKSCSPPNPVLTRDLGGAIIPRDVAEMPYKTVVVQTEASATCLKPTRLMQIHGKSRTWYVNTCDPDEWWLNTNHASICAENPSYSLKLTWKVGNCAHVEQFNEAANKFVFVGTIERQ